MRLINVSTLKLEEFIDTDAPDYAILSHTWGKPDEELQFKQMDTTSKVDKLANFPKIAFLCKQAAKDRLEYAWYLPLSAFHVECRSAHAFCNM